MPCREHRFRRDRVLLNPVDRLPAQGCRLGNGADTLMLVKQGAHEIELRASVGWFPTPVFHIGPLPRVRDASFLRRFRGFRMGLRRRGHKSDQRITDGLVNGVLGGAVEHHAIDHRLDDDACVHQAADGLGGVVVAPPQAIYPPHDDLIAGTYLVEQSAAAGPVGHFRAHAGNAMVGDDLVDLEACRFGLRPLMFQGLRGVGHAGIEERSHRVFLSVQVPSVYIPVRRSNPTRADRDMDRIVYVGRGIPVRTAGTGVLTTNSAILSLDDAVPRH